MIIDDVENTIGVHCKLFGVEPTLRAWNDEDIRKNYNPSYDKSRVYPYPTKYELIINSNRKLIATSLIGFDFDSKKITWKTDVLNPKIYEFDKLDKFDEDIIKYLSGIRK